MAEVRCRHCGGVSLRYPMDLGEEAVVSCGRCNAPLFRIAELRLIAEGMNAGDSGSRLAVADLLCDRDPDPSAPSRALPTVREPAPGLMQALVGLAEDRRSDAGAGQNSVLAKLPRRDDKCAY